MLTMDPKSWRLYAIPLSVCSVVLDFPPLLLGCATTALILKLLWRSCLSLFFRTHKPCTALGDLATDLLAHLAFEEEALGPTILSLEEWPY